MGEEKTLADDLQSIRRLTDLADYAIPITIAVVASLGVADVLSDGARSVEDISERTRAHPRSLCRALRALASRGIFREVEPGRFALTPMAELFRSNHPLSLRWFFVALPSDVRAWAAFSHTLRTGEAAFKHVHGLDFWKYLEEHPEESRPFDRSMEALSRLELLAVRRAYEWDGVGTVVDVGGGNGTFLAGLLEHNRRVRGLLFDLPHVVEDARERFKEAGLSSRCDVAAGSFFEFVPPGGDAYVLKRIIYSWDDQTAVEILRRVRSAMHEGSRALILDPLRRRTDGLDPGKLLDVQMMLLGKGRVRSGGELEKLLRAAELAPSRTIQTPMLAIVEARPS